MQVKLLLTTMPLDVFIYIGENVNDFILYPQFDGTFFYIYIFLF